MHRRRPNGLLDVLLLALLESRPASGHELVEALRGQSTSVLVLGDTTIYPALDSLERRGLVVCTSTPDVYRLRRMYELSADGQAALDEGRPDWRAICTVASAILASSPAPD